MAFLLNVSVLGSALVVFLSLFPGVLPNLGLYALLACPFWLPATCVGGVVYLDPLNSIPDLTRLPFYRRRWVQVAATLVILNVVLALMGIPRWVAFEVSRRDFDAHVEQKPASSVGSEVVRRRLGLYHVENVATDARGGVYFETQRGPDGLSARTRRYGFAHRPNPWGSPFGDRDYARTHVAGDWYSFAATSDE
jgi:hypothetical protein